jgi:CRISPR system Cascade subunit CasC
VHWESLLAALGDPEVARRAVEALITAAATVQPTGKQNSFAAHNLPDLVLVEVRTRNLPVSYANAFLQPVRATREHSLMDASAQALARYMEETTRTYDLSAERAYIATHDYTLTGAQRLPSLDSLVQWLPIATPEAERVS